MRARPIVRPAGGGRHSLLSRIGNTPLLRLRRIGAESPDVEMLFKPEWMNPSGSVKDRSAYRMIREAEQAGQLTRDHILLDASSGNNGTSLAFLGALLGYPVVVCMPENVSPERKRLVRAYGAEPMCSDPARGSDGAICLAHELASREPDRYCYLDQYSNPANWQAHYHGTAAEIWRQTGGRLTHFVAAIGSSGTFVGVTRRLREWNPGLIAVSVQPDRPDHGLKGMKHMPTALAPSIYDALLADANLEVSPGEAREMTRRLAREEGLLVGVTSGAALVGCLRIARELREPARLVTIFADGADKYLGESIWQESSIEREASLAIR